MRIFVIIYGWLIVCNYLLTNQRQINQLSTYLPCFCVCFLPFPDLIWICYFMRQRKYSLLYKSLISFFANAKLGTVIYQWLYGWFNLQNIYFCQKIIYLQNILLWIDTSSPILNFIYWGKIEWQVQLKCRGNSGFLNAKLNPTKFEVMSMVTPCQLRQYKSKT